MLISSRKPDFIGLGGMRCGSTTLWTALQSQPDIFLPEKKELHYFDNRDGLYDAGLSAYLDYFSGARKDQLCGEITPEYMSVEYCCRRIYAVAPEARLIVILRDPIARAWSHYRKSVGRGAETLSFIRALELEPHRLKNGDLRSNILYSYKERGRYIEHLKRFESTFGRSALLVVMLSDLKANPKETIGRIREHIGLSRKGAQIGPESLDSGRNTLQPLPRNKWVHKRLLAAKKQKDSSLNARASLIYRAQRKLLVKAIELNRMRADSPIDPEAFTYLTDYFAPYNQELRDWLGQSLPW